MKNTYDFLVQERNFLLPLSLKVLQHKERDTHSFYSGFSICTRHKGHWPGFDELTKVSRLLPGQDSTQLTLSKSPKSSARFRYVTSFALLCPVSHLNHCDISEGQVRSARPCENTCLNVAAK